MKKSLFYLFQLSEIVNSLSPQGQLPLGIALMSRSTAIAQTLFQNGKADVNAYDADVSIYPCSNLNYSLFGYTYVCLYLCSMQGCTLLIDAVKRGDGFAAQFLLEKECDVNLTSRVTANTALHLVCTYSEKSCDSETLNEMIAVGKTLLEKKADPNVQNRKG